MNQLFGSVSWKLIDHLVSSFLHVNSSVHTYIFFLARALAQAGAGDCRYLYITEACRIDLLWPEAWPCEGQETNSLCGSYCDRYKEAIVEAVKKNIPQCWKVLMSCELSHWCNSFFERPWSPSTHRMKQMPRMKRNQFPYLKFRVLAGAFCSCLSWVLVVTCAVYKILCQMAVCLAERPTWASPRTS